MKQRRFQANKNRHIFGPEEFIPTTFHARTQASPYISVRSELLEHAVKSTKPVSRSYRHYKTQKDNGLTSHTSLSLSLFPVHAETLFNFTIKWIQSQKANTAFKEKNMWEKFDEEKAFETTSLKQSDKGVLFPIMIVEFLMLQRIKRSWPLSSLAIHTKNSQNFDCPWAWGNTGNKVNKINIERNLLEKYWTKILLV